MANFPSPFVLQQADALAKSNPTIDSILVCPHCIANGFKTSFQYGTIHRVQADNVNVHLNQLELTNNSPTCPQCGAGRDMRRA